MATTTSPTHALPGPDLDNRRIAAAAIDLAAPMLAALALFASGLLTPAVAFVLVGWVLYYFFALESGGGQTVGKRAMNLKVVSADGREPTMEQYAKRTVARVVDMTGIGLLVMLRSGDQRQRLGDMFAHTSVVDVRRAEGEIADSFDVVPLQAEPAAPESKPKRSRPGLGGPELKLPSFGRSKAPKEPKEPKPAKEKKGRPGLGGPELKLPSFGRSKAPKQPKEPKPAKQKKSRPGLGGPELKLPSFGRKKRKPGFPEPELFTFAPAPEPEPALEPEPAPEPEPELKPYDPFAEDAAEPSVEVVAYDAPEPSAEATESPAPEIMQGDAPEVEIVREDPPEESPAPQPAPPMPPEPLPAAQDTSPPEPEPEPEPETKPAPEPEHVEGIRDDGSSRVNVKPVETVSAMELLMSEAEEHSTGEHRQDRRGN